MLYAPVDIITSCFASAKQTFPFRSNSTPTARLPLKIILLVCASDFISKFFFNYDISKNIWFRTGGKVNATVEKVNKKYVIVSTHIGGEKWRVPATMLTKLSDIKASA